MRPVHPELVERKPYTVDALRHSDLVRSNRQAHWWVAKGWDGAAFLDDEVMGLTLLAFDTLSFVDAFERGSDEYCNGAPEGHAPRHAWSNKDGRCRLCGEWP